VVQIGHFIIDNEDIDKKYQDTQIDEKFEFNL